MAKKRGKKSLRSPLVNKQSAVEAANGESPPVVVGAPSPIPVLAKVCRLCETKEGPFLNIFGGEKNTASKIVELLPFGVAENDELPHQICFRCSAKVEELHEFVQKCIKTQENLYNNLGKRCPISKLKTHRSLWEEKLNRSNITNDDICDAVIKKAMEGIKDIPLKLSPNDIKASESKIITEKSVGKSKVYISDTLTKQSGEDIRKIETEIKKKVNHDTEKLNKNEDLSATEEKSHLDKSDDKISNKTRSSRSNNEAPLLDGIPLKTKKIKPTKPVKKSVDDPIPSKTPDCVIDKEKQIQPKKIVNAAPEPQQNSTEKKDDLQHKPFNIMEHVSMIKVNGVGVLFQCKLCNRNFLKKEVVLSHWCAKNGAAKEDFIKRAAPPEPPRVTSVKYINTKIDDVKKQHVLDNKAVPIKINFDNKESTETEIKKINPEPKKKPKIGPACKIKRTSDETVPLSTASESSTEPTPTTAKSGSFFEVPAVPSLNCRYKLVPGPNNTFTLVEAHPTNQTDEKNTKSYGSKKRKLPAEDDKKGEISIKQRKVLRSENAFLDKPGTVSKSSPEIIDLVDQDAEDDAKGEISPKQGKVLRSENTFLDLTGTVSRTTNLEEHDKNKTVSQPYPVGLFQTVSRHSKNEKPPAPVVVPFAISAQKKQSYTIVQTGNPSKLLISAKPQPQAEEIPKKKQKKPKPPVQVDPPLPQQPFSETLDDASHPKNSGFFTFINVDPLLQPSYVLPTDNNTIQESQISTSQTAPNSSKSAQYTCNMCDEKFNREQKLLVHINCHYSKMDEEDQMRFEKPSRKRGKKS